MTTNPQDNLGPWRDCGLLKNGCRSEGRCLGHSMTHIEDSELQAKVNQFIDDIAVLRPYTRVTKEAKRRLIALIKSDREASLTDFIRWYNREHDSGYGSGISEERVDEYLAQLSIGKKQ
jgi:hypothetical protein